MSSGRGKNAFVRLVYKGSKTIEIWYIRDGFAHKEKGEQQNVDNFHRVLVEESLFRHKNEKSDKLLCNVSTSFKFIA